MTQNREPLERQLDRRKAALEAYEKTLESADAKNRDPKWRSLDADRRKVATRLHALKKVEERDAALAAKKTDGGSDAE